jgi:hypothetical protein
MRAAAPSLPACRYWRDERATGGTSNGNIVISTAVNDELIHRSPYEINQSGIGLPFMVGGIFPTELLPTD